MSNTKKETLKLLALTRDTFPAFSRKVAEILARTSPELADWNGKQRITRPEPIGKGIPTLKRGSYRPATPMIAARFEFAGTWTRDPDKWLGLSAMRKAAANKKIQQHIQAQREFWEGSASALYPPDRLSLFAVTPDAEENMILLVWPKDARQEPALWKYSGHNESKYKNLNAYLRRILAEVY